MLVPGAGAGAGAVSWLCTWWRQVASAGAGCRCWVPGAVSWLCTWWRQVADAVAGCRCWCWVPGAGAGAVLVLVLCTWWRQVAGSGAAGCRCGAAVSCLCRLRTFFFQPVACQQVVGFCLAIYLGLCWCNFDVLFSLMLFPDLRTLTYLLSFLWLVDIWVWPSKAWT